MQTLLYLREQHIDPPDILCRLYFRHYDYVKRVASLFNNGDDILVGVFSLQIVDTHGACFLPPAQRFERMDDLCSCSHLFIGRNGIFQVEKNQVGAASGGLLHHTFVTGRR